jgi:hypothetical protein
VPVAVNCCVLRIAIEGFAGVTSMETRVAAVTVNAVEPLTEPEVAVMVVEPIAALEARPLDPLALLTVATAVLEELQVTEVVRSWVDESV